MIGRLVIVLIFTTVLGIALVSKVKPAVTATACDRDAKRYCAAIVKNGGGVMAIGQCLIAAKPKLTAGCRRLLASHGQ